MTFHLRFNAFLIDCVFHILRAHFIEYNVYVPSWNASHIRAFLAPVVVVTATAIAFTSFCVFFLNRIFYVFVSAIFFWLNFFFRCCATGVFFFLTNFSVGLFLSEYSYRAFSLCHSNSCVLILNENCRKCYRLIYVFRCCLYIAVTT